MAAFQGLLKVPGLADSQDEEDEQESDDDTADAGQDWLNSSLASPKAQFRDDLRNGAGTNNQIKQEQKQQQASITK